MYFMWGFLWVLWTDDWEYKTSGREQLWLESWDKNPLLETNITWNVREAVWKYSQGIYELVDTVNATSLRRRTKPRTWSQKTQRWVRRSRRVRRVVTKPSTDGWKNT